MNDKFNKNWEYLYEVAYKCNADKDETAIEYEGTDEPEENNDNNENNKNLKQNNFTYYDPFYKYFRKDEQNENETDTDKAWGNLNLITKAFLSGDMEHLGNPEKNITIKDIEKYYECHDIKPYENQYRAIEMAINNPVTLIQGPPGTGKTETIINILRQIYNKYGKEKTVAVVSNNREALDNIYSSLDENEDVYKCFAKLGNKQVREKWSKERLGKAISIFPDDVLEKYPFFSSTIHSLRRIFDINQSGYQFDYVIMDEASQASVSLGLIAMASAKHLVVLGDTKQLSAIISEKVKAITEKSEVEDAYKEQDGNNFLAACESVFEKNYSILLNEHYRCHPSIIGFCNEYVYDEKLVVKTNDDGKLKIRAVYYDGNDHKKSLNENQDNRNKTEQEKENEKKSIYGHYNLHQIRIFIEEELPRFLEKNKTHRKNSDKNLSIGIISPMRAQLNILEALLMIIKSRINEEDFKKIKLDTIVEENIKKVKELYGSIITDELVEKFESLGFNDVFETISQDDKNTGHTVFIPALTIHKSQGKGYDYVYFLTVADSLSSFKKASEWAQSKSMINVAVSRAKKEFCIIMSSYWNEEKTKNSKEDDNQLFFCKMCDYINEYDGAIEEEYGFVKSELLFIDFEKTLPNYRNRFIAKRFEAVRKNIGDIEKSEFICKFATAYSYEYYVLWDILLGYFKDKEEITVYSYTDTYMLESWSLAYAKSKNYKNLRINFRYIKSENIRSSDKCIFNGSKGIIGENFETVSLETEIREPADILFFPRTMSKKLIEEFIGQNENNKKEYYICFCRDKNDNTNKNTINDIRGKTKNPDPGRCKQITPNEPYYCIKENFIGDMDFLFVEDMLRHFNEKNNCLQNVDDMAFRIIELKKEEFQIGGII